MKSKDKLGKRVENGIEKGSLGTCVWKSKGTKITEKNCPKIMFPTGRKKSLPAGKSIGR
jgi:hypothetical protein